MISPNNFMSKIEIVQVKFPRYFLLCNVLYWKSLRFGLTVGLKATLDSWQFFKTFKQFIESD